MFVRYLVVSVLPEMQTSDDMDFFQSPYYGINKRFLSCLGQWPLQKSKERFFFRSMTLFLVGSIFLPKVMKFIEYLGNLNGMINCIPMLALHSLSAMKFYNCSINDKKLKKLTYQIKEHWTARSIEGDATILERYARQGRILTIYYAGYLFATLWMYLLLPLIPIVLDVIIPLNQSREHMFLYETEYFIDQNKYYYFVLIHAYLTVPVSVCMIVAFDTMFGVYVHHACGIFATLGTRLEKIQTSNSDDKSEIEEEPIKSKDVVYEKIVSCIKMHKEAMEFAALIESSTCTCFFFVIGTCMLMITLTGYMTVTSLDEPGDALRFGAFALGEVVHMFYLCWQGQLLMDHSLHIFVNAYNVDWYDISPRGKRLLILIMMRSSVPCRVTAGKLYILSLENFTTALKTSMSYFTVLLSME